MHACINVELYVVFCSFYGGMVDQGVTSGLFTLSGLTFRHQQTMWVGSCFVAKRKEWLKLCVHDVKFFNVNNRWTSKESKYKFDDCVWLVFVFSWFTKTKEYVCKNRKFKQLVLDLINNCFKILWYKKLIGDRKNVNFGWDGYHDGVSKLTEMMVWDVEEVM